MKLLIHIKSLSTRGGAERAVLKLADDLARRGHEVAISVCHPAGTEHAYPIPDTIKVIYLGTENIRWYERPLAAAKLLNQRALKRYIRKTEYDVILGWLRYGAAQVGLLPKDIKAIRMGAMRNVPYGVGPPPKDVKGFFKFYHRRMGYARNEKIFVQMPQFYDVLPPKWREKSCVIPNAVEVPETKGPDYGSREKLIIAVARLVDVKRLDHLVRGFALFHKVFPDWKLEIWGQEGRQPRRDTLQKLINDLGVGKHARLMGVSQDMESIYKRARIMAHPSEREGMSNSVTEALARGIPVIAAADCAGMDMLIKDGESGLLIAGAAGVEPLAEQISHALQRLVSNPQEAIRLGQGGRQHMIKTFAPKIIYDKWEQELFGPVSE